MYLQAGSLWAGSDLGIPGPPMISKGLEQSLLPPMQHFRGTHGPSAWVPLDQNTEFMKPIWGAPCLYPLLCSSSHREERMQGAHTQKFVDF